MKLRFFTSCRRENSVRDKVRGKKWVYLERYTLHRQNAVCLKRQEQPQGMRSSQKVRAVPKYGVVSFYGLGNFTG